MRKQHLHTQQPLHLQQIHQQIQQQQLQLAQQPTSPPNSRPMNQEEQVMQSSVYQAAIQQQQAQALHLKHLAQINAQLQQQVTVYVSCCCNIQALFILLENSLQCYDTIMLRNRF